MLFQVGAEQISATVFSPLLLAPTTLIIHLLSNLLSVAGRPSQGQQTRGIARKKVEEKGTKPSKEPSHCWTWACQSLVCIYLGQLQKTRANKSAATGHLPEVDQTVPS